MKIRILITMAIWLAGRLSKIKNERQSDSRLNTPQNSLFALDPNHMDIPGEDEHGFRALAERSMLADDVKDSGAVSMFPALAEEWLTQVQALGGWQNFQREDFRKLKKRFGVSWVVLQRPGVAGLSCPYQNNLLLVCRID